MDNSEPELPLHIFYRGTLKSCQYSCAYCPFAKRKDSRQTLEKDAAEIKHFLSWVANYQKPTSILITPWGEALIRKYYQHALLELANLEHVVQVGIQTNLHVPLDWLEQAATGKIALWCSFHPTQTTQQAFLKRCHILQSMQIPFSVGMVALREYFEEIRSMRNALPDNVYLWLNANNDLGPHYYESDEIKWLSAIDPWFSYSVHERSSHGAPCYAGEKSIAVDGSGNVQRCQFLRKSLGNLYQTPLDDILSKKPCTRQMCDCYIGYAMRQDRPFLKQFGNTTLARIPLQFKVQPKCA